MDTSRWNRLKTIEEIDEVEPEPEDITPLPGLKYGDVNCDGVVDVADISTIISVMAGKGAKPVSARTAEAEAAETE